MKIKTNEAKYTAMKLFLQEKWSKNVNYSCCNCLEIAYFSELNNTTGYVTDDELIELSNNKLKHK